MVKIKDLINTFPPTYFQQSLMYKIFTLIKLPINRLMTSESTIAHLRGD